MIKRLQEFIDSLGLSIRAFEIRISASNGLIRKAITNNTDIQSKWLVNIVDNFPQLNPDWLLTGRGNMINSENNKEETNRTLYSKTKSQILDEIINYLGMEGDKQLAKSLNVSEDLIKFWRKSNVIDYEILEKKFPFISPLFLINGNDNILEENKLDTILREIQYIRSKQRVFYELMTTIFSPDSTDDDKKKNIINFKIHELTVDENDNP